MAVSTTERSPSLRRPRVPYLGAGVGLRRTHHQFILDQKPRVPWFEVLTENYLNRGGAVRRELLAVAERYAMVTHGVAMSVGGTDPLDMDHLRAVKQLNHDLGALWSSEHLCFSQVNHANLSGLIPLPFTEESVKHVGARVRQVQDFLDLPFLLENVTYYMVVSNREMDELTFTNAILEEADCGLLLDVNNVYINSVNHGFDPVAFIQGIPPERIGQIHLGGHDDEGEIIKDTHDAPVTQKVWDLFDVAIRHAGPVTTNIEWDASIPDWQVMWEETEQARGYLEKHGG
jgi:hypothetical protein